MNSQRVIVAAAALGAGLLVNLGLLGILSALSTERSLPQDITEPLAVRLVQLPPLQAPEEERVAEPERPQPKPKADFAPDLLRLPPSVPRMPALTLPPEISFLESSRLSGRFVFNADELDQPPQVLVRTKPLYPFRARQLEIEGSVQVQFLVAEDGSVGQVSILDASPAGLFEESVLQAVPHWRFTPGKVAGSDVAAWVVTTIHFEFE